MGFEGILGYLQANYALIGCGLSLTDLRYEASSVKREVVYPSEQVGISWHAEKMQLECRIRVNARSLRSSGST